MKYYYYVVYEGFNFTGRSEVGLDHKVANLDDVRSMEKILAEKDHHLKDAMIVNFIFLREE
ncbi:MAG TPA: hypothetical protein VF803_00880 [Candidatus Paceibacterota bacterium]